MHFRATILLYNYIYIYDIYNVKLIFLLWTNNFETNILLLLFQYYIYNKLPLYNILLLYVALKLTQTLVCQRFSYKQLYQKRQSVN